MDMNLDQLTTRQLEILDFIRAKIRSHGYSPTVREIGSHFSIRSPNGVLCTLRALERKGVIEREHNMVRAIKIVDDHRDGIPYFPSLVNLTNAINS